jgi:hypothetical protein
LLCLVLTIGAAVVFISGAQSSPTDVGVFQLDGEASTTNPVHANFTGDDWANICTTSAQNPAPNGCVGGGPSATHRVASGFDYDLCGSGSFAQNCTIFTGGGSKDDGDINGWAWKDNSGGLPDKDNLEQAFSARYSYDTTLAAGVAASTAGAAGTLTVPSGTWFPDTPGGDYHIIVDAGTNNAEQMLVTGGFGTTTLNVVRGIGLANGSATPAHTLGAPVKVSLVYFGATRFDNSGDSQIGVWLLQNSIGALGCTGSVGGGTKFCGPNNADGHHKDGDILILSDFTNGGAAPQIQIFKWVAGQGNNGNTNLQQLTPVNAASCIPIGTTVPEVATTQPFCAAVNPSTITLPWSFLDKSGTANNQALSTEFYEGGINLSAFPQLASECFGSFLVETRSSSSTSATLKDFIGGALQNCSASLTTTPSHTLAGGTVGVGTSVTDNATFNGSKTGGAAPNPTSPPNVVFSECGPIPTTSSVLGCDGSDAAHTAGSSFDNEAWVHCTGAGAPAAFCTGADPAGVSEAQSSSVAPTTAGIYCFKATWAGDSNYTSGASDIGNTTTGSECFQVASSLLIKKTDAGSNLLPGSGFTVTSTAASGGFSTTVDDGDPGTTSGHSVDQATGNNGLICLDNVPLDTYKLHEYKVPTGYFAAADQTITTTAGGEDTKTCAQRLAETNPTPDASFMDKQGSILIKKVDEGNNLLTGSGFTITNKDSNTPTFSTIVNDGDTGATTGHSVDQADGNNGVICLDGVGPGTYTLHESQVPTGYFAAANQDVTVSSSSTCASRLDSNGLPTGSVDAKFTDRKGSILIKKQDQGNNLLTGSGFTITNSDSNTPTFSTIVNDGDTGATTGHSVDQADGNNGVICLDGVGPGTYTLHESQVPTHYFAAADQNVTVSSPSTCASRLDSNGLPTGTVDATFTDTQGSILILKTKGDQTTLLAGAGFTVTNKDSNTPTFGTIVNDGDTGATTGHSVDQADGSNGVVCLDGVGPGTYDVSESTVPFGYMADSDKTVVVSAPSKCADRLDANGLPLSGATIDAKFVDLQASLIIRKEAKNHNCTSTSPLPCVGASRALLGGATFTIAPNPQTGIGHLTVTDNGSNDQFATTDGVICIDGVIPSITGYTITETFGNGSSGAPANYTKDDSAPVVIPVNDSCAGRTTGAALTPTSVTPDALFVDTPLSQFQVNFTSSAGAGVTAATINCTDGGGTTINPDSGGTTGIQQTYSGLPPNSTGQTYTCTIDVDP